MILILLLNFIILLPTYYLNDELTLAITIILIGINVCLYIFHTAIATKNRNVIIIISVGLFIRIILLFLNYLGGVPLPHDGLDTEYYHDRAKNLFVDIQNNNIPTLYPLVLGFIYLLTDENRLFAQFLNISLFYISFIYFYKIILMMNLHNRLAVFLLLLFALFPQSLIFSTILLRELMVLTFVTIGTYFLLKYIKEGKFNNIIYSIVYVMLATATHSGMVVILISIIAIIILYSPNKHIFNFSIINVIKTLVILSIIGAVLSIFNEVLLSKFINLDAYEDPYKRLNLTSGGSAYLENISTNNIIDVILHAPLKALYLLISPVPIDWRSLIDVSTFFLDSSIYLYAIILIFANYKKVFSNPYGLYLLMAILLFSIVFGYGTNTAGTAIRHRFKIFPMIILIIGLIKGVKKRENTNNR